MKAWLLHLANANPPFSTRQEFYTLKHRLLKRYGHFEGHQIQEIRKDCWGPGRINDAYGEYEYQAAGAKPVHAAEEPGCLTSAGSGSNAGPGAATRSTSRAATHA